MTRRKQMKAAIVHSFDKPLVIEDIPKPTPGPGGVLAGIDPKNPAVMSTDSFRNPEADAESAFAQAKDLALGNPIGALQLLDKYLAQHPDDADAWFLRANCCYRESLWHDAVDSAQKAVDLQPQDIHKWRFLVQCQAALGSGKRRSDPLIDPPTEGTK
jgi:tetratricopeptide (TPR) repeat protein